MQPDIRRAVESWARGELPSTLPAFVIASFGRSGSTMLTDAMIGAVTRHRFAVSTRSRRRIIGDTAWNLNETALHGGIVYKTHDFPWTDPPTAEVRPIFIFGSAVQAARSLHVCRSTFGDEWLQRHYEHLRYKGKPEDFLDDDVLDFRRQTEAWRSYSGVNVLCLRYEALWDNIERLRKFTGLDHMFLPARHARRPKTLPAEIEARIERTYRPVDEYLSTLPHVFETRELGEGKSLSEVA